MTDDTRGRGEGTTSDAAPEREASTTESGAWGGVALAMLFVLFALAAVATVHSVVVTLF